MNLKEITSKIVRYSEWVIGLGIIILSYNYIFEPGTCYSGKSLLRKLGSGYSCPIEIISFLAVCIIVIGIIFTYKKKYKKE